MVEERVKEAVSIIRSFLKARGIIADKVVVFGSYAKGVYTENSDVDIAIVSRNFDDKDIFQKSEMLKGLKWSLVDKIMLPLDIVALSLKEWQKSTSLMVEAVKMGQDL